MTLHELDTVVLDRDLPEHDLRRGDPGAIVHQHGPDAFEVELVRASGKTQAVISLAIADIRPLQDEDLPASARSSPGRELRKRD